MKIAIQLAILLVLLSGATASAGEHAKHAAKQAASNPALDSAVLAFNQRNFGDALKQFETLDRNGMCNEKVHDYMGRCCQQLSQVARAKDNYGWVATYGKDPTLKYYATVAYAQLDRYGKHRTYQGNGNIFARSVGGGAGRSGGSVSG